MRIHYNLAAEAINQQQKICDNSDALLLVTSGTELLLGNIATYTLLAEAPSVGSVMRWGTLLLFTTLSTAGAFVGRERAYDALEAMRDPEAEPQITGQLG